MPHIINEADLMQLLGKPVRVHKNLHKKMYSIAAKTRKGWRVVGWASDLYLHDVEFKVSEAGRKRVREQGRRMVHAYAYGILFHVFAAVEASPPYGDVRMVRYNPFKYTTFVDQDEQPVYRADRAMFSIQHGVSTWNKE